MLVAIGLTLLVAALALVSIAFRPPAYPPYGGYYWFFFPFGFVLFVFPIFGIASALFWPRWWGPGRDGGTCRTLCLS